MALRILQIPFSGGGRPHTEGTERGPEEILKQLDQLKQPYNATTIPVDNANATASLNAIEQHTAKAQLPFLALGGDHAISYAIVKALAKKVPNFSLVIFDAHPDLMQSFDVPLHDNWLRMVIEEGIVPPERVLLFGIRSIDPEEARFMKQHNIKNYTMQEITAENIREVTDTLMEAARNMGNLYLSIDIDALDPAFAPGTGYAEPGGLTASQARYIMARLAKLNFIAGDLVEVNPRLDKGAMTARIAATLLRDLRESFIKPPHLSQAGEP